jgi:hypothetical protein
MFKCIHFYLQLCKKHKTYFVVVPPLPVKNDLMRLDSENLTYKLLLSCLLPDSIVP